MNASERKIFYAQRKSEKSATAAKPESASQLIKSVKQRTRRKYSAEDKIRVVLAGLRGEAESAALTFSI